MKRCPRCQVDKPEEGFNWRDKSKGWRKPECRGCQKADYRVAKARDPDAHNRAANRRKREWRAAGGDKRWYTAHKEQERARYLRAVANPAVREKSRERNRRRYYAAPEKQHEATRRWSRDSKVFRRTARRSNERVWPSLRVLRRTVRAR